MYPREESPTSLPIKHLLIVAGPSGSGKSTFLKELIAGRLPAEIAGRLPAGSSTWTQVGKEKGKKLPRIDLLGHPTNFPQQALLHYDMTNKGLNRGKYDFSSDPRLAPFVAQAEQVTVVTLKPITEQLVSQLVRREFGSNATARLAVRSLAVRRGIRFILRLMPAVLTSPLRRSRFLRRLGSIDRYQTPDCLDNMYARWAEALGQFARDGTLVEQLWLEPGSTISDSHTWRPSTPPRRVLH